MFALDWYRKRIGNPKAPPAPVDQQSRAADPAANAYLPPSIEVPISSPQDGAAGSFSPLPTAGSDWHTVLTPHPHDDNGSESRKLSNCAYSAVVVGLMYHAFFDKIPCPQFLKNVLNVENESFISIETYQLLAETLVPALRNEIANFALNTIHDSEEKKRIDEVIEFCKTHEAIPAEQSYEDYFEQVRDLNHNYIHGRGGHPHGGLVEFVILEMMYGIRISATDSFYDEKNERGEFIRARAHQENVPTLDIQQDGDRNHYKLIVYQGQHEIINQFCCAINSQWQTMQDRLAEEDAELARNLANEPPEHTQGDEAKPKTASEASEIKKLSDIIIPKQSGPSLNRFITQFYDQNSEAIAEACRWPFLWSNFYKNGVKERNNEVLKKRCELEELAANELEKILQKTDNENVELSIEEKWLIVKAVADYADTHCSCKGSKETIAISPFYRAIRLLAQNRKEDGLTVLSSLRSHIDINFIKKKGLSFEQEILHEHIIRLLPKVNNVLSRVATADTRSAQMPAESKSMLDDLHKQESLTEDEAMAIFRLFDDDYQYIAIKCQHEAQEVQNAYIKQARSELANTFKKAFETMHYLFIQPDHKRFYSTSGFFGKKISIAPKGFDRMIGFLMPKPNVPPYAFALYCIYRCQQVGNALPHEEEFIQQYLVSLEKFKDKLNTIQFHDNGKKLSLGEYVAPSNTQVKHRYPLKFIYPKLNKMVTELETEMNITNLELCRKIFTDSENHFRHMLSPTEDGVTITARIEALYKNAQQHQAVVKKR